MSNTETSCSANHLTSFGTGWFPAPNKIDFNFIDADFDIEDNLTIFTLILVCLVLWLVCLIYAAVKDRKDLLVIRPHWMKDNEVS